MKKSILLTISLLLSFSSFSQTDTLIQLPTPVARQVVADLVRGDAALQQIDQYTDLINLLEQKNVALVQINKKMDEKISNLEDIVRNKETQSSLREEAISNLQKELRRANFKKNIYSITSALGVVGILILVI